MPRRIIGQVKTMRKNMAHCPLQSSPISYLMRKTPSGARFFSTSRIAAWISDCFVTAAGKYISIASLIGLSLFRIAERHSAVSHSHLPQFAPRARGAWGAAAGLWDAYADHKPYVLHFQQVTSKLSRPSALAMVQFSRMCLTGQ